MRSYLALVICLIALLVACSSRSTSTTQSGDNIATLRATLSKLNLADPAADVAAHVASGDLRPIGLNGYTCSVPGPDANKPQQPSGIRCLAGTSDAIEGAEYGRLMTAAEVYAVAYNQALNKQLSGKR